MSDLFWLSDEAWNAIEPHLPKNQPGARRVDDRRVISGILRVLKVGCRWRDVPPEYGPAKTVYNRYHRWARRRIWQRIFENMAAKGPVPQELSLDSTHIKAHRSAQGSKGGAWTQAIGTSRGGRTSKIHCLADDFGRPVAFCLTPGNIADIKIAIPLLEVSRPTKRLLADKAYDADSLRDWLQKARIKAVIPSSLTRKKPYPLDRKAYRRRNVIERLFCRLKNWRRIATRYDRLATKRGGSVCLNSLGRFAKWISASIMLPPSLVPAR